MRSVINSFGRVCRARASYILVFATREEGAGHNLCLYLEQTDTAYLSRACFIAKHLVTDCIFDMPSRTWGLQTADFATCHRKPVCLRVTKLYVTSWKITTFFLSEICAATARITVESGVLNVFDGFKKCKIRCFLYLYHKMLVEVIEMVDQPGVQSKITRPSSAQILVVVAQINFEPHPGLIRNKLCHPAPHAGQIQPHRMHRSTHLEGEPSMWDIEMSLIQSKHDITALTIFML